MVRNDDKKGKYETKSLRNEISRQHRTSCNFAA